MSYLKSNNIELMERVQRILIAPQLHYLPVGNANKVHACSYNSFPCWRDTSKRSCMSAFDYKAKGNHVSFANQVLNFS